MKLCKLILATSAVFVLQACSDSTDYNFATSAANDQQIALALTQTRDIPFPNNLSFRDSADGTLNIPLDGADPTDVSDPIVALNALDGFSTTEPMSTTLSSPIDPASVTLGSTVRVFEVAADPLTKVVTSVVAELGPSDVAVAVIGESTLAIVPLRPLKESTHYMGIVTDGVMGTGGQPNSSNELFELISQAGVLRGQAGVLEPLRQFTYPMIVAAGSQDIAADSIIQAWSMQTQSIIPVMQAVKDQVVASSITIAPTGFNTSAINAAFPGLADLYIGTLDLPYYRTAPASANDPVGINSFWQGAGGSNLTRFNTMPVLTSTQTVPVLMSVPNASSGMTAPAEGWPVAIVVHGVTRDRTVLIALADAMAAAGVALIAIDQPMHGVTDPTNPLSAALSPFADTERTFDLDLVNNTTGAPGPDGNVDSSGAHYYSPLNLLATRDNLRQAAADLLVLSASLANIDTVTVPLNVARKSLIGHSLGSNAAVMFLALDDTVTSTSLAMPAAGLVRTVLDSGSFGPPLIAGLAAAGIVQGTPEFAQFTVASQTVIDSGDSLNYAALAAQNSPLHVLEVIGDQTVSNAIAGAPLAGSEPIARLLGLNPAAPVTVDTNGSGFVKFSEGEHSSLLIPGSSAAAFTEIQTQVATFAASGGTLIKITNPAVIASE